MIMMEFSEHRDEWVAYPSVIQGLRASTISSGYLLLLSENPGTEVADIAAFAELFAAAGGNTERLRVASPCPSLEWIRSVWAAGCGKLSFCAASVAPGVRQLDRGSLAEVPRDICPALHARLFDGRPTSVCGNRLDRLVLGPHWISSQCFGRWSECRWAVAARAAAHADRREELCTSSGRS